MKTSTEQVKVTVNDKEFTQDYIKREFESVDDVMNVLSTGDKETIEKLISDLNAGVDFKARQAVRAEIIAKAAGPEKAFAKAVQEFIKMRAVMGKPVTEERAKEIVKATMESE